MKNWKKMIVTAAAFASLALFAGCTSASAVSADEAKELVRQTVGDPAAVVVELESDRDDGVYELEVIVDGVSYEYEVDSRTGQLREVERDDDVRTAAGTRATIPAATVPAATTPAATAPAATNPSRITLDEAKAIAYAHAGVSEADAYDRSYERDDGVYEIDFECGGWDYDYDISGDGRILKSGKERDDDHHSGNHHGNQSSSTQPAATQPAATQPAATQPAATQPAATQPAATQPAATQPAASQTARISGEQALTIAMNHAGVSDARDRDVEWDDGRWEVSFESGAYDYEYDIAADGTVLHWEKEHDHDDHGHDH